MTRKAIGPDGVAFPDLASGRCQIRVVRERDVKQDGRSMPVVVREGSNPGWDNHVRFSWKSKRFD